MTKTFQQVLAFPPGGCEFGPQQASSSARELLDQLRPGDVVSGQMFDQQMAAAALAGLWLRHGFLDRSHNISQSLDTAEGSYWHGIMHRREPDYGNGKYWFRRVGQHAVFADLAQRLNAAIQTGEVQTNDLPATASQRVTSLASEWDPFAFVDLCQQAAQTGNDNMRQTCEAIADLEWQALFDYCRAQAGS